MMTFLSSSVYLFFPFLQAERWHFCQPVLFDLDFAEIFGSHYVIPFQRFSNSLLAKLFVFFFALFSLLLSVVSLFLLFVFCFTSLLGVPPFVLPLPMWCLFPFWCSCVRHFHLESGTTCCFSVGVERVFVFFLLSVVLCFARLFLLVGVVVVVFGWVCVGCWLFRAVCGWCVVFFLCWCIWCCGLSEVLLVVRGWLLLVVSCGSCCFSFVGCFWVGVALSVVLLLVWVFLLFWCWSWFLLFRKKPPCGGVWCVVFPIVVRFGVGMPSVLRLLLGSASCRPWLSLLWFMFVRVLLRLSSLFLPFVLFLALSLLGWVFFRRSLLSVCVRFLSIVFLLGGVFRLPCFCRSLSLWFCLSLFFVVMGSMLRGVVPPCLV